MKYFKPFSLLAFLSLVVCSGCATTNRYKGFKPDAPPVTLEYVYATRDANKTTNVKGANLEPVEYGSMVVHENVIYLASEQGSLEALYRDNFQRKWQFAVKNGVPSQILLDENSLYFGAGDGRLYSLDAEFGKVNWEYLTKVPVYARPTVAQHRVYFLTSDDTLYCLDAGTGKWIWHYKRNANLATTIRGNSTPVVDSSTNQSRVYVGFSDGYFAALNSNDGNVVWETKIHDGSKFTDVDASAVFDENKIYIPSYDGALYVLNKADGKMQWKADVGGSKKVLIEDKNLYIASTDGHVYSLNKETGKQNWKFAVDEGVPTNIVLHEGFIAFGSSVQHFYVIDKNTGGLTYRYSSGMRSGFSSDPIEIGKRIYIFSKFGNLYTFRWNK